MEKTALITGISGQDGSYLADRLLQEGYKIVGLTRDPQAAFSRNTIHLKNKIELLYTSYELASLIEILQKFSPSEIYNCAGQTYVAKSWEMQDETLNASAILPCRLLEAIVRVNRKIKFFQSSTSEIYSLNHGEIFTEHSPISPGNPYGCSKAYAQNMVAAYRQNYGLFAVSGILFNHESPRRHENFASQKIVKQAVKIKLGLESRLLLGNLNITRDWGYAPDYVEAIVKMMRQDQARDLILCTGVQTSLRSIVEIVFAMLELDFRNYVVSDPKLMRPSEPAALCGSNSLAKAILGWAPKTTLEQMLGLMIQAQLEIHRGSKKEFLDAHPL